MRIFISHAIVDKALIQSMSEMLRPYGITLLVAEHFIDLNNSVTDKIERMIRTCDLGIVLLTRSGFDSKFVHQEIGYLKAMKKPVLQIVESSVSGKITGFFYGRDRIVLDPDNPDEALKKIKNIILRYWDKKQSQMKKAQEEEEKRKRANFLFAVGIFAGLLWLASKK